MKIGRPRLKITEKKADVVGIRFTPAERRVLEEAAGRENLKLSKWIRKISLERASVHASTVDD